MSGPVVMSGSVVTSGAAGLDAQLIVERGRHRTELELVVRPGEVLALLGPNGAGKTTAIEALAGLIPLTGGRIQVDGDVWDAPVEQVGARPPQRRRVGLVLADHLLLPHLSLLENVAFGPRSRGVAAAEARSRARSELEAVGIAELADRRPGQVSQGQAQRAALARALATDPQLLLLDEPLAALDPATRATTRAILGERLRATVGVVARPATIMVTHDAVDALTLADRLVFLENGRATQAGTPAEVVEQPRSPYAAALVGLNIVAAQAFPGRSEVELVGGGVVATRSAAASETVWVAIAPSAVALFSERPVGSPRNCWRGVVADIQVDGQRARVTVAPQAAGTAPRIRAEITLAALAGMGLQVGAATWVAIKASEVRTYPR